MGNSTSEDEFYSIELLESERERRTQEEGDSKIGLELIYCKVIFEQGSKLSVYLKRDFSNM